MKDDKETKKRREYVAGLYEGPRWKSRVAKMPAHKITAIYLDHVERQQKTKKPEPPEEPKSDQLSLLGESVEANPPEERASRPMPCPECGSTKGYSRMGKFRSQCLNCNALLQNAEINREDQEPQ